jgi:hypothetical protein
MYHLPIPTERNDRLLLAGILALIVLVVGLLILAVTFSAPDGKARSYGQVEGAETGPPAGVEVEEVRR